MSQGQFSATDIDQGPPPAPPQKKTGQFSAADIDPPAKGFLDQVADYPKGIWENLVQTGQGMVNLVTTDPRETIKGIGAAQDAMRVKALDAFKKGDYVTAGRHALEYLIPMAGPQMGEMGDIAQRGEVGRALGQATSLGLQMAGPGALHANAPAIVSGAEQAPAAIKSAAQTAGAVTKGAIKGGVKGGLEPVGIGRFRVPVPASMAGGYIGGQVGSRIGMPELGTAAGAAYPVAQGAIKGGRAALADRVAAGLEAQRAARVAAAAKVTPEAPVGLLGAGRTITPEAPPDTSYVRSVPAEYPEVQGPPAAPQAQPKGLLGPGPNVITPEAPPDTSFVKSVPAEYPQVEGAAPAAPVPAAPAGPDPALLEGIAQGQIGKSFLKATQAEQSLIRNLASRLDQPVPEQQAAAPVRAPQAPSEAPQPAAPGRTIQQVMQEELAARKAAEAQPAAAPAANEPTGRPDVESKPVETPPGSTEEPESVPQLESPRSQFNAAGERKSPLLRAAEITAENTKLKAQRFAQAMHGYVSANELQLIPKGRVDPAAIAKGAVPGWGNITDDLIAKGLIEKDEVPPNASIPKIVSNLRELETAANKAKLTPVQPSAGEVASTQQRGIPEAAPGQPVAGAEEFQPLEFKESQGIDGVSWIASDAITDEHGRPTGRMHAEVLPRQNTASWAWHYTESDELGRPLVREYGESPTREGAQNDINELVASQGGYDWKAPTGQSGRPAIESKPVQPSPGLTGKAVLQAALEKNKSVQPSAGEVASTQQRGIPEEAATEQARIAANKAKLTGQPAPNEAPPATPPAEPSTLGRVSDALQEQADAAIERMRQRGTFKGTQMNALVPVDDLKDMAIWGAAKIAQGTVDFAKWSKEMIADAGPQIKPHLQDLFNQAQKIYGKHVDTTADQLPATKQLLKLSKLGAAGKEWYTKTRAELESMFGPDADQMVKFLAATSPNNTVAGNVSQALKAYRQWRTGQPFEGFLPLHADYLNKIAAGEKFGKLKVDSFVRNLAGETEPVTVDRWIARAFKFPTDQPTPGQYKFMDYTLTQIAKRNGLEPRQLQAMIWTAIKEADAKGATTTSLPFEELLPKKIAADPQMQILIKNAKAGEMAPARP